jgi:hypothetical protein
MMSQHLLWKGSGSECIWYWRYGHGEEFWASALRHFIWQGKDREVEEQKSFKNRKIAHWGASYDAETVVLKNGGGVYIAEPAMTMMRV